MSNKGAVSLPPWLLLEDAMLAEALLWCTHRVHSAGKGFLKSILIWCELCSVSSLCACVSVCASGARSSVPCTPVPPPALPTGTDTTVHLTGFRLTL